MIILLHLAALALSETLSRRIVNKKGGTRERKKEWNYNTGCDLPPADDAHRLVVKIHKALKSFLRAEFTGR